MLFYISINTISCIFVFSLFDSLCPEAVPNVYFIEHCTLTFFNILTPKISRIPKNNYIYIIHTLGDTLNFSFHFTPLSPTQLILDESSAKVVLYLCKKMLVL